MAARGETVEAIVCDPPAGISFMGRAWDGDRGGRDQWVAWMQERAAAALALVPPGGHALVWALPRTSHWTATAWEDAGWEVRDRVSHLFGVGFPKSLDVGKAIDRAAGAEREVVGSKLGQPGYSLRANDTAQHGRQAYGQFTDAAAECAITAPATEAARQWAGWGTALKPACEDWWLLRKPLAGLTVAGCVQAHGTGALNIDATRIAADGESTVRPNGPIGYHGGGSGGVGGSSVGRWPAHLVHDGSAEVLEAFAAFGTKTSGGGEVKVSGGRKPGGGTWAQGHGMQKAGAENIGVRDFGDTGTAARFFYSAKASKLDRAGSSHPTVKPINLMRWLVRLVTPPGGTVLDCFAGSGSTLAAATLEGFASVGIEQDATYIEDIHRRLAALETERPAPEPDLFAALAAE